MEKKLLFFHANWCEPCKKMKPIVQGIADEGTIDIEFVDVDEETLKVEDYSIKSVPALILMSNHGEEKRGIGLKTKQEIINFYNSDLNY